METSAAQVTLKPDPILLLQELLTCVLTFGALYQCLPCVVNLAWTTLHPHLVLNKAKYPGEWQSGDTAQLFWPQN